MSELNSHIRAYGPLRLVCGNPVAYLDRLRDSKSTGPASAQGRIPRPTEKLAFADFVAKEGGRAPKTFALIANSSGEAAASLLKTIPPGRYFCKPNRGCNGVGAFRLTVSPDGPMMDDEQRSFAAVAERLSSEDYVIQEWLAPLQHSDIARFKGGVINTLRLVTFDTESGPKAVAASLRMAISLTSIDSWTQGGVVAAIDLERGVLKPFGVLKKGLKIVDAHPGSGLGFRDQPVPHLGRAVAMACRLHGKLQKVKSLGWDIALLDDGPCILESNGRWDILMSAQLNPDLTPALIALHLPQACDVAVRLDVHGSFVDRVAMCRSLGRILGSSLASGRIERFSLERMLLTVGGTRQAVQAAVQIFKSRAKQFGAARMAIAQSESRPSPGLDVAAAFAVP